MERKSGVLLPLFSLPGAYGIGTPGEEARHFIDLLAAGGFTWWQMLPLCLPGEGNSPYRSFSAFSYNYLCIDLPTLYEEGLLTAEELRQAEEPSPYLCPYPRLWEERMALLSRAGVRLRDRGPVYAFLDEHPHLAQFCRFMAVREENGGRPFLSFQTERYREEVFYTYAFTQYVFYTQFQALHTYAAQHGVRLMGDLPIYVDHESADVWGARELFALREDGTPSAVAGVPPDYFSATGQKWGNPLYDWARMQQDDYAWWRARLRHTLACFDGVRIDHFRAFASYYAIPADAPDARTGQWLPGPGMPLVQALQEEAGEALIVAEDLGCETPDVQRLLSDSGLPGMRVLQFGFLSPGASPHQPHAYPHRTVAYTGTHDNGTLLSYLLELTPAARAHVFDYCGYQGTDIQAGFDAVLRTMLSSHAGLVILPVQDLLRYGCDTRINRPGTPRGNWEYRVTREQLDSLDLPALHHYNALYGRL